MSASGSSSSPTSVLRLERQIHVEQAQSLAALHAAFARLSGAVLAAAHARGFAGEDALEALAVLSKGGAGELAEVGRAASELWLTFFSCFRADETGFEARQFAERAGGINARLAQVGPGGAPDAALARDIIAALSVFWQERYAAISGRIDALIADLSRKQSELGTAQLTGAHRGDELDRANRVVSAALAEVNEVVPPDEQFAERTVRLLRRYRAEVAASQAKAHDVDAAFARFLDGVRAIAQRVEPPELPAAAARALAEVRAIDAARRTQELSSRELHARVAQLEAERASLIEQLSASERRVAEADAEAPPERRMQLYQQAVAAFEAASDPRPFIDQIRVLERVMTLPRAVADHAAKVGDRHLGDLARTLGELRAIIELAPDPRRYRPRLFGSDYDFRSLQGISRALADAGRDLLTYADRARWAAGVRILARHVPKLRAVFKELVALIAAWRRKLGDPPPVSISISVDSGGGVIALPAILAADLDAVLGKRKGAAVAADIAPLIEAGIALYRRAIEDAGGAVPSPSEAPKRESAVSAVQRLSADLTRMAATIETTWAEAAREDFRLGEEETALLADDHLLRLGLAELDAAAGELAAVPGAPAQAFATSAARGKDVQRIHAAIRERSVWFDLLARYRVVIG